MQSPIKPIAKSPSPTQARAIEFYAGAEASASLTPFYDTTLGLGAVLGLEQQRGFDIRLGFAAGTTRVFGSASPAVFELATLALEACPLALRLAAQLDLYPCGGFALGAVRGQGRAAPIPNEALALWADARVGARMKLRLGRWSLVAGGGALLPLTRPTFVFEKPRIEVTTVPAIAAFFTIGVEKRFP